MIRPNKVTAKKDKIEGTVVVGSDIIYKYAI